jgi:hypothetical protein
MATNAFDLNAVHTRTHAQGNNLNLMNTHPFHPLITAPLALLCDSDIKCNHRYSKTTYSRYQKKRLQPSD